MDLGEGQRRAWASRTASCARRARGPGGLRARLGRHWDGGERLHWHVDYLRRAAQPAAAAWVPGRSVVECRWAHRLASVGDLEPGPAGFGASDCRCPTHLFRVLTQAWTTTELAHRLAPLLSYHDWVEAPSAP